VLCTSTAGASPVTVIDSSRLPTRSSTFNVAVKFDGSSNASRLSVLNPVSVYVTS